MSASLNSGDKAEPNLTPILDMVFQLITFFMLVINFKNADRDMSLALPVVGSARPVETKGAMDFLTLNIRQDGTLMVQNAERDIFSFIKTEGQATRMSLRLAPGAELPTTVVIRADKRTPFYLVYRVVKACQEQGYRKFNYMAMSTVPEP